MPMSMSKLIIHEPIERTITMPLSISKKKQTFQVATESGRAPSDGAPRLTRSCNKITVQYLIIIL